MLTIVFRDNLHQPQYVEKLDKLVRFCIKEKVLSLQDLNRIWAAQDGKHEIIVKNIHDLLVKLAWDFSPEQLDHLFGCFQVWTLHVDCTCIYVYTQYTCALAYSPGPSPPPLTFLPYNFFMCASGEAWGCDCVHITSTCVHVYMYAEATCMYGFKCC